jgi:threonine dehydrogenase-like Zn-dependent dehydrogenase
LWIRPAFSRSGGLSTLCLVDAERAFRAPDDVPSKLAALTEPPAIGLHTAHLANRNTGPNLVIGCGPVGLALTAALYRQGKCPIIATGFSERRRAAAEDLGCDIVLDPGQESPFERWDDLGFTTSLASPLVERSFRRLPPGANIFDCVGKSGLIESIIKSAPRHSHVIVVGVRAHEDKLTPREAIVNELTLDFSSPADLRNSSKHCPASLTTRTAPMPSLPARCRSGKHRAFGRLAHEPDEIKALINPRL